LIEGKVAAIPVNGSDGIIHKIPHIGWNELLVSKSCNTWEGSILENLPEKTAMYFIHSFMALPLNPQHCIAECDYDGIGICAVVQKENVIGCQFHPEKSGSLGLQVLKNFLNN